MDSGVNGLDRSPKLCKAPVLFDLMVWGEGCAIGLPLASFWMFHMFSTRCFNAVAVCYNVVEDFRGGFQLSSPTARCWKYEPQGWLGTNNCSEWSLLPNRHEEASPLKNGCWVLNCDGESSLLLLAFHFLFRTKPKTIWKRLKWLKWFWTPFVSVLRSALRCSGASVVLLSSQLRLTRGRRGLSEGLQTRAAYPVSHANFTHWEFPGRGRSHRRSRVDLDGNAWNLEILLSCQRVS